MKYWIGLLLLAIPLAGCSLSAYTNTRNQSFPSPSRATFNIQSTRGNEDVLFLLALSGGGSRAAYLSASAMLKLQTVYPDIDLLKEVDLISSVSGGSLPAAYYAISKDPEGVTVKLPVTPDCNRLRQAVPGEKLICNGARALLGLKEPLSDEEKSALTTALPGLSHKVGQLAALGQIKIKSNRDWNDAEVRCLMTKNYQLRWIGNWFWPSNIVRYWFTAYDRSDIMAQTFEDNLFDVYPTGDELTFGDLNPERPYLIINATDGTTNDNDRSQFGTIMTFTNDDFTISLNSDINSYSVARGAMASAAFPGAFNYMTLRDYHDTATGEESYMHLFDGGNADNLGLTSIRTVIMEMEKRPDKPKHYVVVLVDAFKEHRGVKSNDYDPRSLLSYVVDMNFLDTFDAMLENDRKDTLEEFKTHRFRASDGEPGRTIDNMTFWHLTFEKIPPDRFDHLGQNLKNALSDIPTSFSIDEDNAKRLDQAVDLLIEKNNACLVRIKEILTGRNYAGLQSGTDPCDREP